LHDCEFEVDSDMLEWKTTRTVTFNHSAWCTNPF